MDNFFYQVDAFTRVPFKGNPAGVCILENPVSETWMQQMAAETRLEVAYILPEKAGYQIRWFTPTVEVALCGHATLAGAYILWSTGRVPEINPVHFLSKSGELTACLKGDWIELNFPTSVLNPIDLTSEVSDILQTRVLQTTETDFDILAELENADTVTQIQPDFEKIARLKTRGLIITGQSNSKPYDFVSRFFLPAAGINEDPVTGSIHCALTPYWSQKLGKQQFLTHQASDRGGDLKLELSGNRTLIAGQAVMVFEGQLDAPQE